MSDSSDWSKRKARHDRLLGVHGKALTLILHESRLVLDRTNTFLVTTSFLLAAYGFSLSARNIMCAAIPIVGLLLSTLHPFLIARTIRALEFWRSTAGLVESDPDYWFPGRVFGDQGSRSDVDLDFLLARQRRSAGEPVRQDTLSMRLGRPPDIVMRLQKVVPDPNTIFSTWVPMLIGLLWIIALAVALTNVKIAQPAGRTTGSAPAQVTRTATPTPSPTLTPTPTPSRTP